MTGRIQDALLAALAAEDRRHRMSSLARAAGLTVTQARNAMARLIRRELAARDGHDGYRATWHGRFLWSLNLPTHLPGGRQGRQQQQMWHAMRVQQKFSAADIAELACGEADPAAVAACRRYARALELAGYLIRLPGRGPARWRLVRDSGPNAPRHRRNEGRVIDRNTGESWPCVTA